MVVFRTTPKPALRDESRPRDVFCAKSVREDSALGEQDAHCMAQMVLATFQNR